MRFPSADRDRGGHQDRFGVTHTERVRYVSEGDKGRPKSIDQDRVRPHSIERDRARPISTDGDRVRPISIEGARVSQNSEDDENTCEYGKRTWCT